ncbi:GNAT family N-acetyltransferase [Natronincola ferrireducens]|uniref:Acetyltransferase (GNAT) domain-containing protein n=1 Tax=Natronincola ferrireducens TaxID=393762 RepID=A0A1G9HNZ5_9FIRM|nr:GNAT family N-acetyltransferase [Natronincola ferrireducens]SDL14454.1 Acetyltransferase (GNAT) domain-containing protein [Natronincola ferrireducens]
MIIARGEKTYITELQREQVNAMELWGKHKDPLFHSYNFPKMTEKQKDYWYRNKAKSFTKRCFGVCNLEDSLVGYIALRNIGWIKRTSELGIVFDPEQVNKGYGTDSLKIFLDYYFTSMKMKQLNLKVALFNKRAQQCYKNCGFEVKEIIYDEFEDQELPVFEEEALLEYRDFFKKEGTILLSRFKNMYITREMYLLDK